MQPKVSVIIPAFNAENSIADAVLSVIGQEYDNMEIIIIDDVSSDNTKEKIAKLSAQYAQIVFYENNRKKGPSGARNTGLIKASGNYIAFLDSDDLWLPNHLKTGVRFLEENHDIDVVFFNFKVVDFESQNFLGDWFSKKQFLHNTKVKETLDNYYLICDDMFNALLNESFMHLQSMIVRRQTCKDIFFKEDIMHAEDRDFAIRLSVDSKARFAFKDIITGIYYHHPNSLTSSNIENEVSIINDHITLFKSYMINYKLDEEKQRKIKRLLYNRCLTNCYLHRKKAEFSKSLAFWVASLRYGLSTTQLMGMLKIIVEFCRSTMKPKHQRD